jgi:hypothetical protein
MAPLFAQAALAALGLACVALSLFSLANGAMRSPLG